MAKLTTTYVYNYFDSCHLDGSLQAELKNSWRYLSGISARLHINEDFVSSNILKTSVRECCNCKRNSRLHFQISDTGAAVSSFLYSYANEFYAAAIGGGMKIHHRFLLKFQISKVCLR